MVNFKVDLTLVAPEHIQDTYFNLLDHEGWRGHKIEITFLCAFCGEIKAEVDEGHGNFTDTCKPCKELEAEVDRQADKQLKMLGEGVQESEFHAWDGI